MKHGKRKHGYLLNTVLAVGGPILWSILKVVLKNHHRLSLWTSGTAKHGINDTFVLKQDFNGIFQWFKGCNLNFFPGGQAPGPHFLLSLTHFTISAVASTAPLLKISCVRPCSHLHWPCRGSDARAEVNWTFFKQPFPHCFHFDYNNTTVLYLLLQSIGNRAIPINILPNLLKYCVC